MTPYIPNLYS